MRFLSCIKLIWIVRKYKTRKSIPRPDTLRRAFGISREKLISAALSNLTCSTGELGPSQGELWSQPLSGVLLDLTAWEMKQRRCKEHGELQQGWRPVRLIRMGEAAIPTASRAAFTAVGEEKRTHWRPFNGTQRYFNMVIPPNGESWECQPWGVPTGSSAFPCGRAPLESKALEVYKFLEVKSSSFPVLLMHISSNLFSEFTSLFLYLVCNSLDG